MDAVERLFDEFVSGVRNGQGSDPRPYLAQVEGIDRRELQARIVAFLERSSRLAFNRELFDASPAAAIADEAAEALLEPRSIWKALLPRLREQAHLKRADLVASLSRALGAPDQEQKVASYYHLMEQGQLEPSGVSSRVFDALADLLGESADLLRRAGEAIVPQGETEQAVFARLTSPETTLFEESLDMAPPAAGPPSPAPDEWDDVDRLFRGGAG